MKIYHIISFEDWQVALKNKIYSPPSLKKEGFIHASTRDQVLSTANRRYKNRDNLLLLVIDADKVNPEIKFESTTNSRAKHPHIYGSLNMNAVIEALKLSADENSEYTQFPTNNEDDCWLYMVECNDGSYYTGISKDINNRVLQHNHGEGARYTDAKKPVELVYFENLKSRSEAMKKEYKIKQLTHQQKEELITSLFKSKN